MSFVPHHAGVAIQSCKPVVVGKTIQIDEYFGNVANTGPLLKLSASACAPLSACVVTVHEASEEAWQTPLFAEYVLVLSGKVELVTADGVHTLTSGQGASLPAGLRVKWQWPGPCRYVPICLPGFTPRNCGREEEAGNQVSGSQRSGGGWNCWGQSADPDWWWDYEAGRWVWWQGE